MSVLYVDIAIVIIILLSALIGYARGFIKTVFSCFSVIAALVLAAFFGSHVGSFIKDTDVYKDMTKNIRMEVCEFFEQTLENGIDNADAIEQALNESQIGGTLERFGINTQTIIDSYKTASAEGAGNLRAVAVGIITTKVMTALANALGSLIVFIVSLILLKIISNLLDKIAKAPVLKSFNKFLGIAAGIALGIIGAFVVCVAIEILIPYLPENPVIYMGMENDTVLYRLFVNLSPLVLLLFA